MNFLNKEEQREKEGKKQVNIYLEQELIMKAKMKAVSQYITFSSYIKKLIEDDIKNIPLTQ